MSACKCPERGKKTPAARSWRITRLRCNYSAFNGYKKTPSDYSTVQCIRCWASWRTKASYVNVLPVYEID